MKSFSDYNEFDLFEEFLLDNNKKKQIYTEIYNRFSSKIYNYCLKILKNRLDANDAFSETFVKFYEITKTDVNGGLLKSYLYRAAHNNCVNIIKRRTLTQEIPEDASDFNEDADNLGTFEIVENALDTLPFYQKELFILRYYQGLGYDEISKITMTDASIIRTRIHRIIQKLQKLLKPHFEDYKRENI
jgi:RNA polymerase sigma-70 factor (ECF subfamily)